MLVDSHCHLDAAEFDADRDAVVARARAAGVTAQVVPAIALSGFGKLRALCAGRHADLHAAYGLHPMYLAEHRPPHLDALREWLERERPVAVGECGLDFFVEGLDAEEQRRYFVAQLQLAREFDLPAIIHARRAVDEVIATIRRVGGLRGVVHSFAGSAEQARQLWNLGFLVGLGGPVTYGRAHRLRALVATMPLDYLLLETDAPDQPLATHRGERNEPSYLGEVAATIAALRGIDAGELARATGANARRLFALGAP
ncbi:TatD DNase family protein [Dokdonella fugitiva]|uniref:TatD DNase family protein n=1 Tax=Dokdonella fugitiva TaxID=328517 RepID=A0A4R2I8B6_9GAMM|nr:TatD DNase family protein [Dokdonella fugitiva]